MEAEMHKVFEPTYIQIHTTLSLSNFVRIQLPDSAKMDSSSNLDSVAIASADDPSTQPELR